MMGRFGWGCALALLLICLVGAAQGAQRRHPADSINPVNAKLLSQPASERAAELAQAVGHWCVGTEAFPMGVVTAGRGARNAYWSLRCADGSAWAVQVGPLGETTAIDCQTFNANGAGKECFKKF